MAVVATIVMAVVLGVSAPPTALAGSGDGWSWPLSPAPKVVATFDQPTGPYAPGHRGVDLAGSVGQPVLAVADGRVSFVAAIAGVPIVVVDHGAQRSTYQPVSAWVHTGDSVSAGDPLGSLSLAGSHCWPAACLHLGRVVGSGHAKTYLNPLDLLGGQPVRLLPLGAPVAAPRAPPEPALEPAPSRVPRSEPSALPALVPLALFNAQVAAAAALALSLAGG
ncbi:MAG: peptidoglycan DD-metalloendopeptidase family protein [Nocardioidaceae bacterium]